MAAPFDIQIAPEAVIDFGFVAFGAVEGLGLNTFGFLWPLDGIWSPCCPVDEGTQDTVWTECVGDC